MAHGHDGDLYIIGAVCLYVTILPISHSLRSCHNMSPPDPWKWKWSNGEMGIIWCIYHKQCWIKLKIQWNSSNGQLPWFPIDSLWKWSKREQNYANANAFFSDWKFFLRVCHLEADVQGFLKIWWFLLLWFFEPELWLFKDGSKLKKTNKILWEEASKNTTTFVILQIEAWNE